jgi:hypothetical protein
MQIRRCKLILRERRAQSSLTNSYDCGFIAGRWVSTFGHRESIRGGDGGRRRRRRRPRHRTALGPAAALQVVSDYFGQNFQSPTISHLTRKLCYGNFDDRNGV